MPSYPSRWTWLGLFLALLGPLVVAGPPALLAGDPTSPAGIFVFLLGMWGLVIATAAVVLGPERSTLASIGLDRFRWRAAGIGLAAAVAITVAMALVLSAFGSDTNAQIGRDKETFTVLPTWLKVFTAITAGATEEWLYRGYAITRLSWATGNRAVAAAISLAVFTLGHLPMWGAEAAVAVLIAGFSLTLLYLWTRDLVPVVVAHVAIDAFSLFAPEAIERTF